MLLSYGSLCRSGTKSSRMNFTIETDHWEDTMAPFTRSIRPVDRPGRLHLAILEWQRQLIEMKRPVATAGSYQEPQLVAHRP
jgi:hypothetical protein